MAGKDHTIHRDAQLRKSKLDVFNQEHMASDFIGPVSDPCTAALFAGFGMEAHIEGGLDEEQLVGAGGATAPRLDGAQLVLETNGTIGDFIIARTPPVWDTRLQPELQARIRYGAGGDDISDSRIEVGFHRDLTSTRNTSIQYASVVRSTERESGNFQLVVASNDYRAISIDQDAVGAAELVDQTADAQNVAANDVTFNAAGVEAAQVNDGLIFTNPRRFKTVILVTSTVEAADSTYITEYWNGTAYVAFTPAGGAYLGSLLGRAVIEIPNVEYELMGRLDAGSVIGQDGTAAQAPAPSVIGHFCMRIRISVAGGGNPALLAWCAVEEWADTGVALVENQYHDITLQIAGGGGGILTNDTPTTETSVRAKVDDGGWAVVGAGALDISTGRDHRVCFKLETLAAETKRLDIDAFQCFQARDGV